MFYTKNIVLAAALFGFISTANAVILDFNSMAESSGSHGESAWNPLSLTFSDFSVNITGSASDDDDSVQYAYLDAGNAGLGVCKDLLDDSTANSITNSGDNLCKPSSDDNITFNEVLHFVFNQDVVIENLWFNNNHDGGFNSGDMIDVEGVLYDAVTGYAGDSNGIGSFLVSAGDSFDVAFYNEQFYMSAMEVRAAVPEPGIVLLMGAGMLLLGATSQRKRLAAQA